MSELKKLYEYLLSLNIKDYEKKIFEIIPELKNEEGFDQKNEWHCFDVWDHTLATINCCDRNKEDRLVLLLHDIGKPFSYQDDGDIRHFKNHALVSSKISEPILKRLKVSKEKRKYMIKLIEMHSTKIDINMINIDNLSFYLNLLKIQKCDADGYEKTHSLIIKKQLDELEVKIKNKYKK